MVLAGLALLMACNASKQTNTKKPITDINLTVNLTDTIRDLDSLRLYAWTGIQAELLMTEVLKRNDEGGYNTTFVLNKPPKGMYYLGSSLQDLRPMFLGTEHKVVLMGSSTAINQLDIKESALNQEYEALLDRLRADNERITRMNADFEATRANATEQQKVKEQFLAHDKEKKAYLDSLRQANSELARIMAFNVFPSYQNHAAPGQTPGNYFAARFLEPVDFNDAVYLRVPFYYENIKNYTSSLTVLKVPAPEQQKAVDSLLVQVGTDNPLHHSTLVAAMFGSMNRNNKLFVNLGQRYLNQYKGKNAMLDQFVIQQVAALKGPLGVGDEAIDLKAATPEGNMYSLESMRGKYVLIDFWASWCGPCRRENPNVVRLYNQYKDKGFDILGVSLDNNKEKWIAAIAKDQLTWKHISDLKGWASQLAKPYGVRGIPYTVLVDPNGQIIATRLRGASLEAKLREIFGS